MIKYLIKIRDYIMHSKQYIARTTSYLSLFNSGALAFLLLSKLKEVGYIEFEFNIYSLILFFVGTLILLRIIGWIDIKVLKGVQQEAKFVFKYSPDLVEMKDMIQELLDEKNKGGKHENI